jgi:flagellar basal-body rod protein FlgB
VVDVIIESVSNSVNFHLAQKLLDGAVTRQNAIATNIANVETPGFRRLDVAPGFKQSLQAQMSQTQGPNLATLRSIQPQLAEDNTVRAVRADGNSVEIESELLAMSRNQVDFEFLSTLVGRHIKGIKMAITGRVL